MSRVLMASPDRNSLDVEMQGCAISISLNYKPDGGQCSGGEPPSPARHLLFRVLAYRLQADQLGDLDADTRRLLERAAQQPTEIEKLATQFNRRHSKLSPGTVLVREWKGEPHRVMVLADGFAWNDEIFESLSNVAFAITGTRWNGPRFFGLRDKPERDSRQ
jgi:hypothetical protein